MAFMDTGDLTIPDQILTPWLGKIQYGSVVATLSDQTPMRFGQGSTMTFDIGEAEYVAEGANKGASTVTPTTKTVKPFKFHKTLRWTEEVMWADEDVQMGVVSQILDLIQPALSRALDFGVLHGINPTGGAEVAAMTDTLDDTANSVEIAAAAPYTYLDTAQGLILADGFVPRDIALDPSWASAFSVRRGTNSEVRLYPNFVLRTAPVSELDGFRASVSNTVGAVGVAAVATTVKAFMGDFSAIRWGVQRQIGLEVIRYGDPDGQGDLKRNNQIAFRAEVVYGWGIADTNAFAKILDAA
jgi:hypothetical protein